MDEKLDSIDPPDSRNVFLTFTDLFLFCQNYFIQFWWGFFFQLKSFPAVSSISGFLAPASSAGSRWLEILFFVVDVVASYRVYRTRATNQENPLKRSGGSPMQTGTHLRLLLLHQQQQLVWIHSFTHEGARTEIKEIVCVLSYIGLHTHYTASSPDYHFLLLLLSRKNTPLLISVLRFFLFSPFRSIVNLSRNLFSFPPFLLKEKPAGLEKWMHKWNN